MWQQHGWKVIMFNMIYLMYPIMLSLIVIVPNDDIYHYRHAGITVASILFIIEINQMLINGFCNYITELSNLFDMFGIISTILFFALGTTTSYSFSVSQLTIGIVGSYYKGIMATSSMSGRFRVLIKLLFETFKDMIPYTIMLITQIMIFAILSKTSQIT